MTALKKIWKTPYQVQKGVDYEIDAYFFFEQRTKEHER